MGAERLSPSNFEGQSEPASWGYILSGAALLPPIPIQIAAGAGWLRSTPAAFQPNTQ
jgi:hypothetical protein